GLADGIGHLVPTMKSRLGKDVRFQVFEQRRRLFSRLGVEMVEQAFAGVEERAAFARFGL
ncbi:MAG: S49 family peptidase, partial [Pseudomonadota bacterium]